MSIKVGQIYRDVEDGWICVITLYSPVDIYYVWENGSMGHKSKKEDFLFHKIKIAEYTTWQEAVCSKEFRDE